MGFESLKLAFVIFIWCTFFINSVFAVIVEIPNGKIEGNTMKSRNRREFYAFRGIPYAKPPIGELRFKSPEPIGDWENIYDATNDAEVCLQKDYMFHSNASIEGSEDCLYLNVYTPTVNKSAHLPVIVQIHYGGLESGNSKSTLLGPQYLLDKDVILVIMNYRLGIFGFYTTLDDASPGNYGLKDQRLALRWVQSNIANFGGNPNLVTITGVSAGAGSVHNHILSPSSQGLFHRAIASSGAALDFWARPLNFIQKDFFRPVAEAAGCNPNDTTTEIMACMNKLSGDVLVSVGDTFKLINNEPLMIYNLVKEKRSELNPEPFLEEDTSELIKKGEFQKVPFIMGVVPNEGLVRFAALIRQEHLYNRLTKEFDILGPKLLLEALVPKEKIDKVWRDMKEFYLGVGEETIDIKKPKTIQGFLNMFSDISINFGAYQSILYQSYKGYKNLWMYSFEYEGKFSFMEAYSDSNRTMDFDFGVCHADDYIYLFPAPDVLPELPDSDLKMSETFVEIWTHFAEHGEPPKITEGPCKLDWKRIPSIEGTKLIKNKDIHYLKISNSNGECPFAMTMQEGFLKERINFWLNIPTDFHVKDGTWEK